MSFDYTKQPGRRLLNRSLVDDGKVLISIITPYYNAGKYFEQTYNCVMNQTFPWFEWIIVDDGTTDEESLEILDKFSKLDKRIKVIHKENGGISSARNAGIKISRAEYFFTLDADDLIEPTYLEYSFWALHFNPDAAWAYADSVGFGDQEYIADCRFDIQIEKKENILTCSALIRKSWAMQVGLYTAYDFHFYEDWHFFLKILEKGGFPVQCDGRMDYLFWYRRSQTGVLATVRSTKENLDKSKKIINEQAARITDTKPAVIYPTNLMHQYAQLHTSDWTDSIYKKHEKIHVLFFFPHLVMGGANKFNLDLIKGLDKNKYEASIITTLEQDNVWLQLFREETPEIFNLPNFLSAENYGEFVDYFIKSREIDILFVSNSELGYYLLPWIRKNHPRLAIVDYVHALSWDWRNGGVAHTSSVIASITEKTYVCNEDTRQVMLNYFHRKPESIKTAYIGVDEKYFDSTKVEPGKLYEELGVEKERPIVLFISRLSPEKRPFLMLKIAEYVSKRMPEVVFAVVGDGVNMAELKEQVQTMKLENTVYFLGARKDVRPYYKDAKLTLICSIREGLTLTAYESLSMGVPVVSVDVGGQRELVDETVGALIPLMQDKAEDYGVRTFPEEEIKSYGEAIISLLLDKEHIKQLSKNCREKILNGFTIDAMVRYFDKELERLAKDDSLILAREHTSKLMKELGMFIEEPLCMYLASRFRDINAVKRQEKLQKEQELRRQEQANKASLIRKILRKIKRILRRILKRIFKRILD